MTTSNGKTRAGRDAELRIGPVDGTAESRALQVLTDGLRRVDDYCPETELEQCEPGGLVERASGLQQRGGEDLQLW